MRIKKNQINKIRNEKGESITNISEIQGIIKDHLKAYIQNNGKIQKK
jgi:hypothetical protein